MPREFLTTATSEFLNRQSGVARPYFYIEGIISGVTSIIGESFTSTNHIIDGGTIDREKPGLPGSGKKLVSSDVTIKVDNINSTFSPLVTGSIFFDNDHMKNPFNYWGGFENVSGTALLLQRGSYILTDIRIDTKNAVAFLRLQDKFKEALDRSIVNDIDVSGTAIQLLFTGDVAVGDILSGLFTNQAGLTSTDLDLGTGITFNNLSLSNQSVANAVAVLAEAADGFIFTKGNGKIAFRTNTPVFDDTATNFSLTTSGQIKNIFWEQNNDILINRIILDYTSGLSATEIQGTATGKGTDLDESNEDVQSTGDAISFASRLFDRFKFQQTQLEVPSIWLPSIEVGDKILISDNNVGLTNISFEVLKIQEEPTRGSMRINFLSDIFGAKFSFWSDTSAIECGTVFTGGVDEANGWQNNYGFFSRDSGTSVNPNFDQDGDNDNVTESAVTSSGLGGTGIELSFVMY